MKNKTVSEVNSESDFSRFISDEFLKPIKSDFNFPYEYDKSRAPESMLCDLTNPEVRKIIERELIRDNTYISYGVDIYKYPYIIFYENGHSKKKIEGFKTRDKARAQCGKLLNRGIYSILISIMNHDIECHIVSSV